MEERETLMTWATGRTYQLSRMQAEETQRNLKTCEVVENSETIAIPQEARTGAQAVISEKARGLQAWESVHPAEPAIESLEHSLPFIRPTRFHVYLP